MASSRGTIEHGVANFSPAYNGTNRINIRDSFDVVFTGVHKVPIVTLCGYQSDTSQLSSKDERTGNIYFTIANLSVSGFTIKASAPFTGKVYYIISSEGI